MSEPGWYADPAAGQLLRWWDGQRWTDHTHPLPQHAASGSRVGELAGFWQRAAALFIDAAAAGTVGGLASLPAQVALQRDLASAQDALQRGTGSPGALGDFFHTMAGAYADHVVGLVVLPSLLVLAYHAGFLRWSGATPGKLALGIRVRRVGRDGRLPWRTIAARLGVQTVLPSVGYLLCLASGSATVWVLGQLAITAYTLVDVLLATRASRRAGHDLAAGTEVVRTR